MKRLLRSPREIAWRLRQEAGNLGLLLLPPPLPAGATPAPALLGLPGPGALAEKLRGTAFAAEMMQTAKAVCSHHFPLLGTALDTGPEIAWRRDYLSGRETGLEYFRRIPYLDAARAGDHKFIWELNRHQHLVLLAQANAIQPDAIYVREIAAQLRSWLAANPFQRGINWASALEVAFRALSWCWIWSLAGADFDPPLQRDFLQRLYWHGCHLENNLSYYFSPNTHLLGEAVALHALGVLFPSFPRAPRWRKIGAEVVKEQMRVQVRADGSHFEQSTYYHVYALDMFLFHALLDPPAPEYSAKLARMGEFLAAAMGPPRRLPFLGDDDGGRFFYPYGAHDRFGRGTLAAAGVLLNRPEWLRCREDLFPLAGWWMGARALEAASNALEPRRTEATWASRLFPDAGLAVMTAGDVHVLIDAGRFGPWGSGHSHSDTLSIVARRGGEDILIDPGTYTYVGDPDLRNWFRGSAAHNTIRIDGRDQAIPAGPFRWESQPPVALRAWSSTSLQDDLWAECQYGGCTHSRRVRFLKAAGMLLVQDDISGPPGEHVIEQNWHLGSAEACRRIITEIPAVAVEAWASRAFGEKHAAPMLQVIYKGTLPARLKTAIVLGERPNSQGLLFFDLGA